MTDEDNAVVSCLREAVRIRGIPLKTIAKRANIPYRSLHNYFNGTSDMPLRVYLTICREAHIPPEWPIYKNRMKLDNAKLQQALIEVLGPYLPTFNSNEAMTMIPRPNDLSDPRSIRQDAGAIAVFIEGAYDRAALRE